MSFRLLLQISSKQPEQRFAGAHSHTYNIPLERKKKRTTTSIHCPLLQPFQKYIQTHSVRASYLSVLQLHGQNQLVAMVGQSFAVVSLGEECRAQVPMSATFPCLVTWMGKTEKRWKEPTKSVYSTAHVITRQLVFISHHPTATAEQRCDGPHLCHRRATAALEGEADIRSSPQ